MEKFNTLPFTTLKHVNDILIKSRREWRSGRLVMRSEGGGIKSCHDTHLFFFRNSINNRIPSEAQTIAPKDTVLHFYYCI